MELKCKAHEEDAKAAVVAIMMIQLNDCQAGPTSI